MGARTKIEYCDSTINPYPCCDGCELLDEVPHCYAARLVSRYAGKKGWPDSFTTPTYFPERLEQALKWSNLTGVERPNKPWLTGKPRVIFVNDLGDGFSPSCDIEQWMPRDMYTKMGRSPHIWLLLTKWPVRMLEYLDRFGVYGNMWYGTSITSRNTLWRARAMQDIKSWTHNVWFSLEPILTPIPLASERVGGGRNALSVPGWIAAGFESGPSARAGHPTMIRNIRNLCRVTRKPLFFKQWGDNLVRESLIAGADTDAHKGGRVLDEVVWSGVPR